MADPVHDRERMVRQHLAARDIHDQRVLAAMAEVPREQFVAPEQQAQAYEDAPLPIGQGQTISQPYIVALMAQAAALTPQARVLEVGTGSGYAAAVLGRLAARVDTVERHPELARQATARLRQLGLDNVHVHVGDGSAGWPSAAPFDAILVAAAAAQTPAALRAQLAIGGCLVIPVDDGFGGQRLRRIRRVEAGRYTDEDLGGVLFVPLVSDGAAGADAGEPAGPVAVADAEAGTSARTRASPAPARQAQAREGEAGMIAAAAEPLPAPDAPAFADVFERFARCRVVLLGESSHGTAEFYRARAAITRRLVERHGFNIVAVEADWPDAAAVNRHVRGRPPDPRAPAPFQRFPAWMWRNTEVAALVGWMHRHNHGLPADARVGFHGLDLYSLGASMDAVLAYLEQVDPKAASRARERYACLTPWRDAPAGYGRSSRSADHAHCEAEVLRQCRELLERRIEYAAGDGERFLDAAQNARLVAAAEGYYRAMYRGGAESWNLRDTHMFQTLEQLLQARGPEARAVVWAHNSHIGDARCTSMGRSRGELNLGQLCRQAWGSDVALVGFGTHEGTVAAASDWGGPMEVMQVRPSRPGSIEYLCHQAGIASFLLDLGEHARPALRRQLAVPRLQRFIGVLYLPDTELYSHYAQAALCGQFDAYAWFDRSHALQPLPVGAGGPEQWPAHVPG